MELLVVISIIAALVALLLPAIEKARNQARGVACANRQRQVLQAFHAYANDFDGYAPHIVGRNQGGPNKPRKNRLTWQKNCYFYSGGHDKTELAARYLTPSNAYFCPFLDIGSYRDIWDGNAGNLCSRSDWRWNTYVGKLEDGDFGKSAYESEINDGRRLGERPEWPLVSDHVVNKTPFQTNPPFFEGPHMEGRWEDVNSNYYLDATGVPDDMMKARLNVGYPDGSVQSVENDELIYFMSRNGRNATFWSVRD